MSKEEREQRDVDHMTKSKRMRADSTSDNEGPSKPTKPTDDKYVYKVLQLIDKLMYDLDPADQVKKVGFHEHEYQCLLQEIMWFALDQVLKLIWEELVLFST